MRWFLLTLLLLPIPDTASAQQIPWINTTIGWLTSRLASGGTGLTLVMGLDFRASAGGGDPTGYCLYVAGTSSCGGLSYTTTGQVLQLADRNTALSEQRLQGVGYNNAATTTITITLSATGLYYIETGIGDYSGAQPTLSVSFCDASCTTPFKTVSGATATAQFFDADGTLETSVANWTASNPLAPTTAFPHLISHVFTSTTFIVQLNTTSPYSVINTFGLYH